MLHKRIFYLSIVVVTGLLFVTVGLAHRSMSRGSPPEKSSPSLVFEKDIAPILEAKCYRCHGGGKRKRADLDVTSIEGILKGGETGPAIVAGKADESRLYELVHKREMPPYGKDQLTKAEIDTIHRWIEAGAPSLTKVAQAGPEVTQHDIEPLMLLRCAVCHGVRKQEGELDLRTKATMLKGGKSGPAMVLGKPAESLLLKKIHSGEMPPKKMLIKASVKPITKEETALLARWIELGAPEVEIPPDVAGTDPDPLVTEADRDFWSFRPPSAVDIPKVKNAHLVRNPIDAFVLHKLEAKGMPLSPEADRLMLIRRASFDLTGLPPSPAEVNVFLNDKSSDAYERMIDRLLASPRYGERWGKYWLDLAGYADSEGKRSADPIRPHAWRYRDYVIRSFNADKPYDRFLLEQIAGDELVDYANAPEITQKIMDNLVATGFLRMTADGTGSDIVNFVPNRLDVIADEVQVLGSAVLGLTLHCARCHSHKYDPIPQRDYYRLLAVFKGAYDEHDWMRPTSVPGQTRSKRPVRVLEFVTKEEQQRWKQYQDKVKQEIAFLKKLKSSSAKAQIRGLQTVLETDAKIRALWDRGEPSPAYIYRRGDYLQPSKLVGPGVPSVLTDGETPFVVTPPYPGAKSTGRRLALAKWLIQPDHPLTARVMVNRIWKYHFGRGIVATLDNFGKTGAAPTHPELLDWLAREFVARGWSIKAMHRLIMTSATYRQQSKITETHEKLDPENQLFSRMPLKRMEGEVLYDTLLHVSGQLDETQFGPPDGVIPRDDGLMMAMKYENGWRRSIYVRQRRTQILTLLDTFDVPQMNPNCVDRINSTVASQALFLQNNAKVYRLAEKFAERIVDEVGTNTADQIERIYLVAMSRPPSETERKVSVQALEQLTNHWRSHLQRQGNSDAVDARRKALTSYCHSILNSAAFLYID